MEFGLFAPLTSTRSSAEYLSMLVKKNDYKTLKAILTPSTKLPHLVHQDDLLQLAATEGHLDCMKVLLPFSDPKRTDSLGWTALMMALARGHRECVEFLLPLSDPSHRAVEDVGLLKMAVDKNSVEFVKLLLPWTYDQEDQIQLICKRDPDNPCVKMVREYVAMRTEQKLLLEMVSEVARPSDLPLPSKELKKELKVRI